LLLGAGESGKSTIIKQLRLLTRPYDEMDKGEVRNYISSLQTNCLECMSALIKASKKFGLTLAGTAAEQAGRVEAAVDVMDSANNFNLDPELAADIASLWKNDVIQKTFERRSEFWILDGCAFYMDKVEEYANRDFWPSETDVVMARGRTTGIVVTDFFEDPITWKVVDVGGQRSERKKWFKCFDDVKAILFVANLSGYDSVLFEDESKNRMQEELQLLEEISRNPIFADTPVFVFFNKKDVFEDRIKHNKGIGKTFPEYGGKEDDVQASMDFISSEFLKRLGPRKASSWFISARYKKDVQYAFSELKDHLRAQNQALVDKLLKAAPAKKK